MDSGRANGIKDEKRRGADAPADTFILPTPGTNVNNNTSPASTKQALPERVSFVDLLEDYYRSSTNAACIKDCVSEAIQSTSPKTALTRILNGFPDFFHKEQRGTNIINNFKRRFRSMTTKQASAETELNKKMEQEKEEAYKNFSPDLNDQQKDKKWENKRHRALEQLRKEMEEPQKNACQFYILEDVSSFIPEFFDDVHSRNKKVKLKKKIIDILQLTDVIAKHGEETVSKDLFESFMINCFGIEVINTANRNTDAAQQVVQVFSSQLYRLFFDKHYLPDYIAARSIGARISDAFTHIYQNDNPDRIGVYPFENRPKLAAFLGWPSEHSVANWTQYILGGFILSPLKNLLKLGTELAPAIGEAVFGKLIDNSSFTLQLSDSTRIQRTGAIIIGYGIGGICFGGCWLWRQIGMRVTSPIRSAKEAYEWGHGLVDANKYPTGAKIVGGFFGCLSAAASAIGGVAAIGFVGPWVAGKAASAFVAKGVTIAAKWVSTHLPFLKPLSTPLSKGIIIGAAKMGLKGIGFAVATTVVLPVAIVVAAANLFTHARDWWRNRKNTTAPQNQANNTPAPQSRPSLHDDSALSSDNQIKSQLAAAPTAIPASAPEHTSPTARAASAPVDTRASQYPHSITRSFSQGTTDAAQTAAPAPQPRT